MACISSSISRLGSGQAVQQQIRWGAQQQSGHRKEIRTAFREDAWLITCIPAKIINDSYFLLLCKTRGWEWW